MKEEEKIHICFHCEHLFPHREKLKQLIEKENFKWTKRRTSINYLDISLNEPDVVTNAVNAMLDFVEKHGSLFEKLIKESKGEKMETGLVIDCVELLKNNHNIILHGAPGTGKTFLAKEIAKKMGCSENEIGFVQFHQSYDYTDFVEGLRPINQENGQICFERKDGVFKAFCAKAIKTQEMNESNNFDASWEKLLDEIRNGIANNNLVKIGSWEYGLSKVNSLKYSSLNSPSQYTFTITKKNVYDVYAGQKARPSGAFQKDMQDIVDYMKQKMGLGEYKPVSNQQDHKKKYVFIIDEINRGEMSKIFGELFFSIDPGYRIKFEDLEKPGLTTIRTQYANLQEDANEFAEALGISDEDNYGHFFVPENVYIIGTMNDIDRSVESMDFAMRRRFAFIDIKAKDSQRMFKNSDVWKDIEGNKVEIPTDDLAKLINRMDNLNTEILKDKYSLNESYQIGGAYFLKYSRYLNGTDEDARKKAFEGLWKYHIEGVLREYLRGIDSAENLLNDLKTAYKNEQTQGDNKENEVSAN